MPVCAGFLPFAAFTYLKLLPSCYHPFGPAGGWVETRRRGRQATHRLHLPFTDLATAIGLSYTVQVSWRTDSPASPIPTQSLQRGCRRFQSVARTPQRRTGLLLREPSCNPSCLRIHLELGS
jgi:hypothetical protein